ncbi:hypothetical protein [Streptomyces sp. NPDC007991]|uniref:hypothetical protein n=1 Tax=Streptomyces sp. NPDC007991 TaxID=3364803 RepID=UPI0036E8ECB2
MRSVRTLAAAAVLTVAAVAVYAVVRRREARLRREAVSERLMAGCVSRDNAALRVELDRFRRRIDPLLAQQAVMSAASLVLDEALPAPHTRIDPPLEGGPR